MKIIQVSNLFAVSAGANSYKGGRFHHKKCSEILIGTITKKKVTICASVNMIIHSKCDLSRAMKPHGTLSSGTDSPEIALIAFAKYVD